jgi:hypothetical protein
MRHPAYRLRRPLRADERSAVASIGTSLLVAMTVALMVVVGMWVFTVFTMPEEAPEIKVNFSNLAGRYTISVTSSNGDVDLNSLRLKARTPDGDFVTYDSDGDGVPDTLMVADLEELAVSSADGPQGSPLVFVDSDGDGRLGVGDSFVIYETFIYPSGPLMDADRGHAYVGVPPDSIPLGSNMTILASRATLGNPDMHNGDVVQVDIRQGGPLVATTSGAASSSGTFLDEIYIDGGWAIGLYTATFIIRPSEIDEWSQVYPFRVKAPEPITPPERELYETAAHPFSVGDVISLIHEPSQTVVLEFRL